MSERKPGPRLASAKSSGGKVRQTVDLADAQHAGLARWRLEAALQLDVTRVTNQDALQELVAELLDSPDLRAAVLARLERRYNEG